MWQLLMHLYAPLHDMSTIVTVCGWRLFLIVYVCEYFGSSTLKCIKQVEEFFLNESFLIATSLKLDP
jgi:hypothetical protein